MPGESRRSGRLPAEMGSSIPTLKGGAVHEMSLVQGVLDAVVPAAREAGAEAVTKITLRIGEMTMVVRESMEFAFEVLSEDVPLLERCELVLEFVPCRSTCLACGETFEHDRLHMRCPNCDSAATQLICGRELEVASMEIETPD